MNNRQSLFLSQKRILKESGCEDYNQSIKLLFSKAFKLPLNKSHQFQAHVGSNEESLLFLDMVSRRAAGEPTSHIVYSRSFWKNDFYVDKTVLDPRPDSELIVDIIKELLFDGMKVLDLGCGSGCLGISLYHENPNICLSLADLSKKALSLSKMNAVQLKAKCKFIHSDLFTNIYDKFDLIITNLPYVSKEDFFNLQKEIILYEPHEALYGGVSGLDKIEQFIGGVNSYLNENGTFVIEFGKDQENLLKEKLLRFDFREFDFHRDFNGVNRLVCVKKDT